MKKLFTLLVALSTSITCSFAQATLHEMSAYQVDQVLNHCKRVEMDLKMNYPTIEKEHFRMIWDYPHERGCDIYIHGEKHSFFISRPMKVKDFETKTGRSFGFNQNDGYTITFIFFEVDGNLVTSMGYTKDGDILFKFDIESVDFYNENNQCIARDYRPKLADGFNYGNLFYCYIKNMYNFYK